MCPGIRPATGWMPNLTSTPSLGQGIEEFAHLVLRLCDRHAVSRHDHHLAGSGQDCRGLLGRCAS